MLRINFILINYKEKLLEYIDICKKNLIKEYD